MRCGVLKKLFKVASLAFVVLLAGCGGGGGGGGTVASGNGGSNPISGSADNVQPIAIDSGPVNTVNILLHSGHRRLPNHRSYTGRYRIERLTDHVYSIAFLVHLASADQ